jgi:hypothetical protein
MLLRLICTLGFALLLRWAAAHACCRAAKAGNKDAKGNKIKNGHIVRED